MSAHRTHANARMTAPCHDLLVSSLWSIAVPLTAAHDEHMATGLGG